MTVFQLQAGAPARRGLISPGDAAGSLGRPLLRKTASLRRGRRNDPAHTSRGQITQY